MIASTKSALDKFASTHGQGDITRVVPCAHSSCISYGEWIIYRTFHCDGVFFRKPDKTKPITVVLAGNPRAFDCSACSRFRGVDLFDDRKSE